MNDFILVQWPVPPNVRAVVTTRSGGTSDGPYASLNLGANTGDGFHRVQTNRDLLASKLGLPSTPYWLRQVHGNRVVRLSGESPEDNEADAAITGQQGRVCAVLTADCLPVFLCNTTGTEVAVAHGGWRGLLSGVLSQTVDAFASGPEDLVAWLGPAISQAHFEVGDEVVKAFTGADAGYGDCFVPNARGRWQGDLYAVAQHDLDRLGVSAVFGGGFCTYQDDSRFYSYRREQDTGRMASLIWMT